MKFFDIHQLNTFQSEFGTLRIEMTSLGPEGINIIDKERKTVIRHYNLQEYNALLRKFHSANTPWTSLSVLEDDILEYQKSLVSKERKKSVVWC